METINNLLDSVTLGTGRQERQTQHLAPTKEFLKAVLQELTRMGLLNNVSPELYQTWARGLSDLTEKEIKRGLIAARDFDGFFSLASFRKICKSIDMAALGLVDANKAYEEACLAPSPKNQYQWSHPVVYHAGRLTGWSELHSMTRSMVFPMFERNYEILCKRVIDGEDLSIDIPKAIPQHIPQVLTGAENHDRMLKLRKELGL